MPDFDYLIVGAGWFGAVFAHEMTAVGKKCLVLDRRSHIGGNSFTETVAGIHVHRYGPHIFHTNSKAVWKYVNQFARFQPFIFHGRAMYNKQTYSFPINLRTLQEVWGIRTQEEADAKLAEVRIPIANPRNLEEWMLSHVGEQLYRMFIYGYTLKQWQRQPRELPASIVKRLPIRTNADDNYYSDRFQGIPEGGYTPIFQRLLEGSEVLLGIDYLTNRERFDRRATKIVYTGRVDQLFNCFLGELAYRTLRFEQKYLGIPDFQGTPVINYTDASVPYTRSVEHKHFLAQASEHTIVTWEFPEPWRRAAEPYYPINDPTNQQLYERYAQLARHMPRLLLGGRLGRYRYYDMHQVIASALVAAKKELKTMLPSAGATTDDMHD